MLIGLEIAAFSSRFIPEHHSDLVRDHDRDGCHRNGKRSDRKCPEADFGNRERMSSSRRSPGAA